MKRVSDKEFTAYKNAMGRFFTIAINSYRENENVRASLNKLTNEWEEFCIKYKQEDKLILKPEYGINLVEISESIHSSIEIKHRMNEDSEDLFPISIDGILQIMNALIASIYLTGRTQYKFIDSRLFKLVRYVSVNAPVMKYNNGMISDIILSNYDNLITMAEDSPLDVKNVFSVLGTKDWFDEVIHTLATKNGLDRDILVLSLLRLSIGYGIVLDNNFSNHYTYGILRRWVRNNTTQLQKV